MHSNIAIAHPVMHVNITVHSVVILSNITRSILIYACVNLCQFKIVWASQRGMMWAAVPGLGSYLIKTKTARRARSLKLLHGSHERKFKAPLKRWDELLVLVYTLKMDQRSS